MPARRELTLEEYQAREERRREQTRLRVARYRARRNAQVSVTGHSNGTGAGYPPHTPPSPPLSLEREIREALEPLTARGYVHDPRFWVLASEQYPLLCLELEALKLADWLQEPRNAKRRCSKAFLDNWLKKAEADRRRSASEAAAAAPPRTTGVSHLQYSHLQAMRVDPPIAFQHNRQPPDDEGLPPLPLEELVPITREDFQRTVEANRGLPLEQKLARLNGRLKGGRG